MKSQKYTTININFILERQYRLQKCHAPRHMSKPCEYKIYENNVEKFSIAIQ